MTMRLGAGIKSNKGDLWAQALGRALLPGERIRLLVKGNMRNMTDDLVVITDIRLLGAQTSQHCRVRDEMPLSEIQDATPAGSRMGNGVTVTMRDGDHRRIRLTAMRGAGDDEKLLSDIIRELLRAEIAPELRAALAGDEKQRAEQAQRLVEAKQGFWHGTTVVGSRPRAKAAETVLAQCRPGEMPWLIIGSLGEGVLAAFDDRLILVKTGLVTATFAGAFGGARVTSFAFDHITGIEYNSGMINGVLEILTPSYSGTANKDFWRGTTRSPNRDTSNPHALSNTLPLTKVEHAQALPHLNELRLRAAKAKQVQVTVQQQAASSGGIAEELSQLAALRDAGVLDDAEFAVAKKRLLGP